MFEAVGSRAQGMGGAFVAVANDSSATWWNPAGLGDGPFLDMALARTTTEITEGLPARRDRISSFALGTPPLGVSYYRLRITDIQPFDPTGAAGEDRQDRRAGVPVRSLEGSQFGFSVLQTLLDGVHAGTTLKYVRGTLRGSREDSLLPASELLDLGEDLEGGDAENHFDLDVGVLAVAGPVRLGLTGRNMLEPEFADGAFVLPRQVRVGAAFDAARLPATPLTIAVDFDVMSYAAASGDRRVLAVGGEQWLLARRLGLRAGARFNTVGAEERAATAGISVSPRSGLYLDGHVVRGGSADESGWGLAARVSF
ncbi:MAG TPA: conjugal transfer protein TraF [Thermoanaerobaculia bacterium]